MTSSELRQKYLEFFKKKGHSVISSASLRPENDPTVLFTTAGMHPLVPYLIGEKHPLGTRLTSSQKCIRTDDIDEVGDKIHHTFFEMLGNWSLGDYFKQETIEWSFQFLTDPKWLGIDKSRLAVSVFAGDDDAPFDQEAYDKWLSLGIPADRIAKLPKKNNWWGPAVTTGPCGPDTEMFIWTGQSDQIPDNFQVTENDPRWVEIWNDVFMQYNKTDDGRYEPLKQKNVDTGMGLERMLAVLNGTDDNYRTDLFWPIIEKIEKISRLKYGDLTDEEHEKKDGKCWVETRKQFRIIADHIKAAVFAISDGSYPSNKGAGYVVRRLIRRAMLQAYKLGIYDVILSRKIEVNGSSAGPHFISIIGGIVCRIYKESGYKLYQGTVDNVLIDEEEKFFKTIKQGLKEFEKQKNNLSGGVAFNLYQTYGFPLEMTIELAKENNISVDVEEFKKAFQAHQELSRTASAGMFKGGLADGGQQTVRLHTAAHLLLESLRRVLGDHIFQKGSNITPERLRLDFSHSEKMTPEQIKQVEDLVNEQIIQKFPVHLEEMTVEEAKAAGAMGVFEIKYDQKVKVYTVGQTTKDYFSKEICGGPHVQNIQELGRFKIQKEESSSSGVRRIKAVLE